MTSITSSAAPLDKTVLVVEDDDDVREAIERALDRSGYRVLTAAHGVEALAVLRREPLRPSAILLDWMMPVMDGMGFLGQAASDPRLASIPIVVVSAVARMARIPRLCVAAVVAKPITLRSLVDITDRLCGVDRGGGGGEPGDAGLDRSIGSEATADVGTPTPEQAHASSRFGALRASRARNEGCFFLGW